MGIIKKVSSLLHYFEWNIAVRPHFDGDFSGKEHPYTVIKNSVRYWCADPFIFEHNGKTYLFFEAFDKFKSKGLIGYRTLTSEKVSRIRICLETDFHLSYPYIYEKDGNIYMLPESFESGKLTVYKAINFPDKWEPEEVLLDNIQVCDSNYITHGGNEILLTMPLHGTSFVYDKLELYSKTDSGWIGCDSNPVVSDASCARNAGAFFSHGSDLIRPSQNCSDSYGNSIVLNRVKELSPASYSEEKIQELKIGEINYIGKKVFDGIHTLNVNKKYDVIDLRISEKLQPQRIFYLIKSHFKRV